MNSIGKIFSNFKDFYNDINAATLTGAIDVIVVKQIDGTHTCSPFHVRFGKLGVLRSKEKVVDIEVNGEPLDIHMKLGESGEAFFVEELEDSDDNEIPEHLATSPIPTEFENMFISQSRRRSLDLDQPPIVVELENQVNDYTRRRNTGDIDSKTRETNFIKRQITLGNIDICENSTEDLTTSLQTNTKVSSDDLSKDNDISDTIFRMDSLEMDNSKAESISKIEEVKEDVIMMTTPVKGDDSVTGDISRSGKKKRRKTKKKNAPRKSSSANQLTTSPTVENLEKNNTDNTTDRSSLDSNSSEPELKEVQEKVQEEVVTVTATPTNNMKMLDPEFHFFSDTEVTSGNDSRANTPIHLESVQSDSEFEVNIRKEGTTENSQSWEWGGFPNVSQANSLAENETNQKSMLTSVFSFMKQNKRPIINSNDGVYLSDISSGALGPEAAAIYFSRNGDKKITDADMDCESGNGPSLTQSPNSGEGSKSIDSDFDEQNREARSYIHEISLSLCGWEPEPSKEKFMEKAIAFSDLCNNPSLLENPKLVVSIKDKYYNWKVAAPIITTLLIYQRPLPQSTVDQLVGVHMPSITDKDKQLKQQDSGRSYWFWGRSRRSTTPDAITEKTIEGKVNSEGVLEQVIVKSDASPVFEATPALPVQTDIQKDDGPPSPSTPTSEKYRKTLRLSSKQISELNLRDGMNELTFSVTTAYQGTSRCNCYLYKWNWDDKIVISDIDGTITRSDVLGHILPIVGKDWAQTGVAQLFNKIKDNGYKLLYLSARAIGQARVTRDYLKSIRQGDLSMPDGPVLLNPTSLITAFHREVIEKKPEQFKISCMSDIKALFPPDSNPFYAGYGNRINDVWAYRAVGIPIVRIFTINSKGELKHELTQTFQSSYSNMTFIVDHLFPPLLQAANDYSQFVYWRDPVTTLEDIPEIPTTTTTK